MAIKVAVAPKGMGLNDFVAMQEGFFAAEGLDVEFDMKTFRGTQGSWKELKYFDRPQDKPFAEGRSVIQGACAGHHLQRQRRHGEVRSRLLRRFALGHFCPAGFQNPKARRPEGRSGRCGDAGRKPLQRSLPA